MTSLITRHYRYRAILLFSFLVACNSTLATAEPDQSPPPPPTVLRFPTFPPTYTPSHTATVTATRTASSTATATTTSLATPDRTATLTAAPLATQFGSAGDAIAYTCEFSGPFGVGVLRICLMSLGDATPVVFASPGAAEERTPVWSPDGAQIAFESNPDGQSDIFVVNADGAGKTRLTTAGSRELSNFGPRWSPDGERIAFVCWHVDAEARLCIINADGTGLIQMTEPAGFSEGPPAWSPDGTQIAMSIGGQIYLFDAHDTQQMNLIGQMTEGTEPAWSPDGRLITFKGSSGIYTMPASDGGSQPTKLTEGDGVFTRPTWSPDSSRIAFVLESDNDEEVYLVNVDGSSQTRLTDDLTDFAMSSAIRWSPDGTRILYVCGSDIFNTNICVINADGSGWMTLTTNPLLDMEPAWRP